TGVFSGQARRVQQAVTGVAVGDRRAVGIGEAACLPGGGVGRLCGQAERADAFAVGDGFLRLPAVFVVDVGRGAVGVAGLRVAGQCVVGVIAVADGLAGVAGVFGIVPLRELPAGIVVVELSLFAVRTGAFGQATD